MTTSVQSHLDDITRRSHAGQQAASILRGVTTLIDRDPSLETAHQWLTAILSNDGPAAQAICAFDLPNRDLVRRLDALDTNVSALLLLPQMESLPFGLDQPTTDRSTVDLESGDTLIFDASQLLAATPVTPGMRKAPEGSTSIRIAEVVKELALIRGRPVALADIEALVAQRGISLGKSNIFVHLMARAIRFDSDFWWPFDLELPRSRSGRMPFLEYFEVTLPRPSTYAATALKLVHQLNRERPAAFVVHARKETTHPGRVKKGR